MFVKIENGKISENYPEVLRKVITNPTQSDYLEFGWLPFVWEESPEVIEGYHLEERTDYTEADIIDGVLHRANILIQNEETL